MASELRQARLNDTSVADANDVNEFVNTADKLMHIRRVVGDGLTRDGNEGVTLIIKQLSKATSFQAGNGELPPTMQMTLGGPTGGAADGESSSVVHETWTFQRGQLTLEPGEALHTHTDAVDGTFIGAASGVWFIDFEY